MKKLMIGLAVVAMSSAPALAASWSAHDSRAQHYGMNAQANVGVQANAGMYDERAYVAEPGYGAYAQAPGVMMDGPATVYGEYRGTDPDPFIRQQLMRGPAPGQY